MIYRKITVRFKDEPKRFYRQMYIRQDLDLFTLGVAILTALGATFEHYFMYIAGRKRYLPENFEEYDIEEEVFMSNFFLLDLPQKFLLEYDTGDGWDFEVSVSPTPYVIRSREFAMIIKGAGQGIWEDNICALYAYFSGRVNGETVAEDEDLGVYPPWNFSIEKYSDFDNPLDIDALNDTLQDEIIENLKRLEENDVF